MNLHSNMFLLFPCLPRMSASPLLTFTFQYVSIISLPSPSCKSARLNLHSNMFLLFLLFPSGTHRTDLHLHSNMFLLFHGKILNFCQGFRIYIPICFYYFPSNVALYNSTTILPSFVDPVIIFCFFNKIFSFFPKLCIFPTKRQLSTPRLFYLITGRQFSFYMNSPSVSNSSCIISPIPFPVSNSNSYLYVALWISITFRFLPLPTVFFSTFSGNF